MKENKNTAIYIAYDDEEPIDPSRPEKGLLKAILLHALNDLKKDGDVSRRAMEYFLSPEDDYVFSFKSICAFLQLDPTKVLILAGLKTPMTEKETGIPVTQ